MNVDSGKATRRKRKAPQRRNVPTIVEQKEQKPFAFGWGTHLSNREREGLKERVALFTGVVLAIAILGLLGWGLFYDNVWQPAQAREANNRQIAVIGNDVIRLGFFNNFQSFENKQFNSQIQQYQQQQGTLDPKKNALQYQSYGQQIQSLQQALTNLPQVSLNALIDEQVVLQRAASVGVVATAKDVNKIMLDLRNSFGGPKHFQQFVNNSGLSQDEIKDLQVAQWLRGKLQPKLAAQVKPYQLEVRASHILIPTTKAALAQKLLKQAQGGANFAALAKKYSTDAASGKKGGDLGYFTKDRMVAPFANKAFSLKVGQIGFAKSQFGYHIIKVTGRKQIKMKPTAYQTAQSGALTNWLQSQRSYLHLERLVDPTTLPNLGTPAPGVPTVAPAGLPGVTGRTTGTTGQLPQSVPGQTNPGGLRFRPVKPATNPAKPGAKPVKPTKKP